MTPKIPTGAGAPVGISVDRAISPSCGGISGGRGLAGWAGRPGGLVPKLGTGATSAGRRPDSIRCRGELAGSGTASIRSRSATIRTAACASCCEIWPSLLVSSILKAMLAGSTIALSNSAWLSWPLPSVSAFWKAAWAAARAAPAMAAFTSAGLIWPSRLVSAAANRLWTLVWTRLRTSVAWIWLSLLASSRLSTFRRAFVACALWLSFWTACARIARMRRSGFWASSLLRAWVSSSRDSVPSPLVSARKKNPPTIPLPASMASCCEIWPSLFSSASLNSIRPVSWRSCRLSIGPGRSFWTSWARTTPVESDSPRPRHRSPTSSAYSSRVSLPDRLFVCRNGDHSRRSPRPNRFGPGRPSISSGRGNASQVPAAIAPRVGSRPEGSQITQLARSDRKSAVFEQYHSSLFIRRAGPGFRHAHAPCRPREGL